MDVSPQIHQSLKMDGLNLKEATGAPFLTDDSKWPVFHAAAVVILGGFESSEILGRDYDHPDFFWENANFVELTEKIGGFI